MAWYEDLTPCTYFDGEQPHRAKLLAVGWLERGHAYHHGMVDSAVRTKLVALFRNPWQPTGRLARLRSLPAAQLA